MLNISKFRSPKYGWPVKTKVLFGLILLAFVFLSLFCTSFGMVLEDHSTGMGCHFMGLNNADCPMSISHHMDKWLNTFAGLPKTDHFLAFVFLFIILTAWRSFQRELAFSLAPPEMPNHNRKNSNFDHKGRDHLVKALASGIIHPQIYHA